MPNGTLLTVKNSSISLNVEVHGKQANAPVILCVHGWPEHRHSWRHQVTAFADRYTVATMDVRGYGDSSRPLQVGAYTLKQLAGDVAAVAMSLSEQPVILFGHDWGAPIVYQAALRHPQQVRAVAGLSVPYRAPQEGMGLDMWRQLYADRFFYQLYFQQPAVPEQEMAANIPETLQKIYYSLSGDAPLDDWLKPKPPTAGLLDDLVLPEPFPDWLSAEDLAIYAEAFERSGFVGVLNRYRAQELDAQEQQDLIGQPLAQPSCFIAGVRDAVRHFVPGADFYSDPGHDCSDFRGSTFIEGVGHWVQQEAPQATNQALTTFLDSLGDA